MLHQNKRSKKSKSDEWWTEQKLFDKLTKYYNFYPEIDVAATYANKLCTYYFDKKDNALTRNWIIGKKKRKCWLNPPNKLMRFFIVKTYEQFKKHGIQTMMIVPLNVQSSSTWWKYIQEPMESGERIFVRPIEKRPKFLYQGRKDTGSINGYCIVIFGRRSSK